jgi:hypothetical protein
MKPNVIFQAVAGGLARSSSFPSTLFLNLLFFLQKRLVALIVECEQLGCNVTTL